jgi:hypothetical protein
MEPPRPDERDAAEPGPDQRPISGPHAVAAVHEPTVRELDLQRRLVRESLLLRPA